MQKEKVLEKFGKDYLVNNETFIMGIHYLLGDHIAQKFKNYETVLDACCGAGFMSINLAKYINKIFAIDIKPEHLEEARNNAKIANVSSKIYFILGDALNRKILSEIGFIEGAFLDPDWSRNREPKIIHTSKFSEMQPPAYKLFDEIRKITQNIALRLPKEIDLQELKKLPPCELEKLYLDDDFKFYCAYFGKLANKTGNSEFRSYTVK